MAKSTKVTIPQAFTDVVKALLRTPPPPPGDPSTRKKKTKKKQGTTNRGKRG